MNTKLLVLVLLSLGLTTSASPQGSLTPPGAPAPTMKTLDQIEPRKEVNATNTPGNGSALFLISTPGSYYFGGNITGVSGRAGIAISADNVTLDLNGFALAGVAGSTSGIATLGGIRSNIVIRNGTVANWGDAGLALVAQNSHYHQLQVSSNASDGLRVAGTNVRVTKCGFFGNGGSGIALNGSPDSMTVIGCTASSNTGNGISAGSGSTLTNCAAGSNSGNGITAGEGSTLTNCTALSNGLDGIVAATGSTLVNCTARLNTSDGIQTANHATLRGCTLSENGGHGINGSSNTVIEHCAVRANDGNGIVVADASLISASVVNLNGKKPGSPVNPASDGIELGARNRVLNCTIFSNGQHGILSASANNRNYIEGCLMHSNGAFAISLQGTANTVIKNQVAGNTGGTINQAGGGIAPIHFASDPVGTIHPLANFQ
ncbi:MAG: right-handed parallel beta-helix repeat-containing protein [Chthoniobacterales bacterium]